MPAEARNSEPVPGDEDLAQVVLAAHGGDAFAAIRTAVADAAFLYGQLKITWALISTGLVRGWKPKFPREA